MGRNSQEDTMKTFLATIAIVVLTMASAAASAAQTDRSAQMMREANVPPAVLADRIDKECRRAGVVDGSCKPSGANTTVDGFVAAINANPQGKRWVASAQELPRFLRSLRKGEFVGELCLSGVHPDGTVADYCRHPRPAHPGEGAWWAGDNLVLAEDCLNSVVTYQPTELPAVVAHGVTYTATERERTDPFASQRRAVSGGCSLGDGRWFRVMVFEAKAARNECAVRTMLPYGGLMGQREGGGDAGTYDDPNRFSRTCGATMRHARAAGEFNFSATPHHFEVFVQNGGQESVLGKFTVIGNKITGDDEASQSLVNENGELLFLPEEYQTGHLVVRYLSPGELRTPTASGTGERVENIRRGCRVGAFYAIDADGTNASTQGDGFAYGQ